MALGEALFASHVAVLALHAAMENHPPGKAEAALDSALLMLERLQGFTSDAPGAIEYARGRLEALRATYSG